MTSINTALNFFGGPGNSKTQEQFAEYFFLKDIIHQAAVKNEKLNVARSDFDAFGFDLIISRKVKSKYKTRNIQLKATSGACSRWDIHKSLLQMKTGRIILVKLNTKASISSITNEIFPEYWMFDNQYNKAASLTDPKVPNPNKCHVKKGQFKKITDLLQIF